MPKAKYLWHEALHTHVANEQLVYLFLQYSPTYNRDSAVGEVKAALKSHKIVSYALWELIGEHDLLVQAWIPRTMRLSAFEESLRSHAPRGTNIKSTAMSVEEFIDHWMWSKDHEIDAWAAASDVDERHFVELNSSTKVPAAAIRRYREANYLHLIRTTRTIKLFIRISTYDSPSAVYSDDEFNQLFRRALAECPELASPVLMRVLGGNCAFLLSGRVKPADFETIADRLQPALYEHGLLEVFAARTTTQISARRGPIDRREQLLSFAQTPDERMSDEAIRSQLGRSESRLLEFKASAFTDLSHQVRQTGKKRSREEQMHAIVKAVAGFANAQGGTLVIGVAESKRYSTAELRAAGYAPLAHGENLVIGVDRELPTGGWEEYQNQVATKLRAFLEPNATGAFTIRDLKVDGLTLCVVTVYRGTRWYWAKKKGIDQQGQPANIRIFYGRLEASTTPLEGPEVDTYRMANPRADKPGQLPPDE